MEAPTLQTIPHPFEHLLFLLQVRHVLYKLTICRLDLGAEVLNCIFDCSSCLRGAIAPDSQVGILADGRVRAGREMVVRVQVKPCKRKRRRQLNVVRDIFNYRCS
jgi:hypothetical protein